MRARGNVAADIVGPDTWLRKSRRTRLFALIAAGISAAWPVAVAVSAIVGFTKPHSHARLGTIVAVGAVVVAMAVGGLLFARRLARTGMLMSRDGIVVRNPLSTTTIALSDADGFVAGTAQGVGNGTPCPILKLKHAGGVGVWALGREGVIWNFSRYEQELHPLCDELNAVLADLKARRSR
jgi:hypothetical protein